jgi:hypothetical protein
MRRFDNFRQVIDFAHNVMRTESELVHPGTWQSVDVSAKPDMATHEVQNFHAECRMHNANVATLQIDCKPSLPWAEDHFWERVSGEPLNPGKTWRAWPYALRADNFRDHDGQFNHNYMERYWPKYAGECCKPDGTLESARKNDPDAHGLPHPNFGIRHQHGDWQDVIQLFIKDPLTRQAFVPIFFPEDTGSHHGGRVPCTLGYHFMIRRDQLHIVYFMRSCDLRRHFNDDLYLTARLSIWLIDQLQAAAPNIFSALKPGTFSVFISSLHIFRNDWRHLFSDTPTPGDLAAKTAVVSREHLSDFNRQTGRITSAASKLLGGDQPKSFTSRGPSQPGTSYGGQQIARDFPPRRQRPDGSSF